MVAGSSPARRWWTASAAVVVATGLVCSVLVAPGHADALRTSLAGAVLAALVSWGVRVDAWHPVPGLVAKVVGDGLRWGLVVLALHGWAALVGAWAVVLVPWVACLSPDAGRWASRLLCMSGLTRTAGRVALVAPHATGLDPTAMSTGDIGRAWRWSGSLLRGASPVGRSRLVRLRQECLDELERRDPQALQTWLHADPGVDGDPTAHFTRGA